jgi:hypothetical protein
VSATDASGKEGIEMGELRLSRRRLLGAGAAGTLGILVAPQAVLAREEVVKLRWDLVVNVLGAVVPGGSVVADDAATNDVISLTGSGFARPHQGKASGGGTWDRRHSDFSFVDAGVFLVTGFNSFTNGGGSLTGTGVTDAIGELDQTTGGVLSLNVSAVGTSAPFTALLEIHCSLPGSSTTTGGIRLVIAQLGLDFEPPEKGGGILNGSTLFHVLEGSVLSSSS